MWNKISKQNSKHRIESNAWILSFKRVEISDDSGFCKAYESLNKAALDCQLSNASLIKYGLDNGRSFVKRRSNKKIFYVREIT